MTPSLTKRFHNFMQSVKSREDGKRLPEHFNSMISKVLSKRDMEEEKFLILGQLQSVQKSAFLVAMCFSHAMVLRMGGWVRGGGWQKKYKSLKMSKTKIPKMS